MELGDNLAPDAKVDREVEDKAVDTGEPGQARDFTLVLREEALRIANLSGQLRPRCVADDDRNTGSLVLGTPRP